MAKKSIARKWQEKIDRSQDAVKQMEGDAVEMLDNGNYVYIFKDGSSLYQKHRDDWREGEGYIQCPSCEEWRPVKDRRVSDSCAECVLAEADAEGATAIFNDAIRN